MEELRFHPQFKDFAHQGMNRMRKISAKLIGPSPPVLLDAGGTVTESLAVIELFVGHFANMSDKDTTSPSPLHCRRLEPRAISFTSSGGESYNVPYFSELRAALSPCPDSSPGMNDIPYAVLCHISDESLSFYITEFGVLVSFRSSSRFSAVILIVKPAQDHMQAKNYRHITLTSCMCKVLEKMLNERLM